MFKPPPPTTEEVTTARIAKARGERMARDATRPRHRHHYRAQREGSRCKLTCPSCGESIALAVVT